MTTTNEPAGIDLDKLQRFNNRGGLMNPEAGGLYVRYEELVQARASQPEGATGTTGAQDDLDYLLDYIPSAAARAEAKAKVADLRAQLAATTENLQTAVRQAWEANAELSKLRAAPASAQPDRGSAQAVARDWVEDAAHENGNYQCICSTCGNTFFGHKRRITCKGCAVPASQPVAPEAAQDDDEVKDER